MKSKKLSVAVCIVLMLGAVLTQTPPVIAVEKYEKFLGRGYNTTPIIYEDWWSGEHVVASGFGADISIMAPVEPKDSTFTKVAFTIDLGEPWSQVWPGFDGEADVYPMATNMWVKVLGDSYFWPTPNQIVDNTGTGGECTLSWEELLLWLMEVLAGTLFKLRETPPKEEWESEAHWVKAIVRQGAWYLDTDKLLQTAGANFYSYFDQKGYNTLTITAGVDVKLVILGFQYGMPKGEEKDMGGYSLEFEVTVPVTNAPETPLTPSGETSGYVDIAYEYSTSTTDPNGDNVRYEFDWGDGSTTTTGWYASGLTATASHSWSSAGTYYVKVRAQDVYEEWSDWSSSLSVNIEYHDVAVTSVSASPTSVRVGETVTIRADVKNEGNYPETFDTSLYYTLTTDPLIGTQTVTLTSGANTTLTFEWTPNMTGRYEIRAEASMVEGEVDTADNTRTTFVYVGGNTGNPSSESVNGSHIVAFIFALFAAVIVPVRKYKKRPLVDIPADVLKHNLPNNRMFVRHEWIGRKRI